MAVANNGDTAAPDDYFHSHSDFLAIYPTDRGKDEVALTHHNELQLLESLSAVTTHIAHVQFRLRQIINAPLEEKESLLKDLEEFTFKAIPEIQSLSSNASKDADETKDRLIAHLKQQIVDLQNSLSSSSQVKPQSRVAECHFSVTKVDEESASKADAIDTSQLLMINFVKRMSSMLHILNVHCKEEKDTIRRKYLSKKSHYNHWGDIRAELEVAITEVIELALEPELPIDSDYMSESEEGSLYISNQKLTGVIRKKLAPALQSLMEHGLVTEGKSISVKSSLTFVIGCMPHITNSSQSQQTAHVWELILKYYKMKNGDQFNSSPALKLSQSFNLDVGTHCTASTTQKLLITIGNIISSHSAFKRSFNSQFKAFVCAALNAKLLVNWLQLIYRSKPLVEMYYEPWSYAVKTNFEDAFRSLEKLSHYHFNLPVNIAIHQLQNIKDAF